MTAAEALDELTALAEAPPQTSTLILGAIDGNHELAIRSLPISVEVALVFREVALAGVAQVVGPAAARPRLIAYEPGFTADSGDIVYVEMSTQILVKYNEVLGTDGPVRVVSEDDEEFIDELRFTGVRLGTRQDQVVTIRKYSKKKELSRSKDIFIRLVGDRYDLLNEPAYQFDDLTDAILFRGFLFMLNQRGVEQIFRMKDVLVAEAKECLTSIASRVPIAGYSEFEAACLRHQQKMEKLRRIGKKGYLSALSLEILEGTIARYKLSIAIVEDNGERKLAFDESKPWAILSLLDDDYVESFMTQQRYEANSKRVLVAP